MIKKDRNLKKGLKSASDYFQFPLVLRELFIFIL